MGVGSPFWKEEEARLWGVKVVKDCEEGAKPVGECCVLEDTAHRGHCHVVHIVRSWVKF